MLVAVAVLIAVRVALPVAVRRVLVSQAEQALHAQVHIGDVDLALLRGGIALKDVAIRAASAPAGSPPMVAWKRFAVAVRWLPLLRHTVRLRAIELDAPRVAVVRRPDGPLNLLTLVPPAAPAAPPQPGAEPAPRGRWRFGADRVVLRNGQASFKDLTIPDHAPVELGLDALEVADVSLLPGVYDDPGHLRLEAVVEKGRLHLDARLAQEESGLGVAATVRARRLPLHRARFYVPDVGWSELGGELEAALKYRLAPGKRDRLYGTLALLGIGVRVPGIDEPALGWRRLAVRLAPLDLGAHRATVAEIALDGATLLVRPQGGDLLPFLAGVGRRAPAKQAEPEPAAAGEPWRWTVGSLRVSDSQVRLLGGEAPVDVGVTLSVRHVAGDGGGVAPLELTLAAGGGSLRADGALRVAPPGFAGRIGSADLALPELVAAAGALPAGLLQAGSLGADLTVEAGLAADGAPPLGGGDVRVHGTLALAKPWLAGPDATEFAVGGRAVTLAVKEIRVPGVLGGESAGGPLAVTLADVRLDGPIIRVTRTADGLLLPAFTRAAPPGGEAAAAAGAPPAAPETPPPAPARPLAFAVDAVLVTDGQLRAVDRTVTPFYAGELSSLAAEMHGVRWPPPVMEKLHMTTRTPQKGQLDVSGSFTPAGGALMVNGRDIALMPFNPYATTLSGYSLGGGLLSLTTRASYRGGRYTAKTSVTFHRLAVRGAGGGSLFQQSFGVPLEMALALMRDLHGDIGLDVPVESDAAGTRVDLLAVIGGALRHAIVNALASPLKLVGAVFGGGSGETLAPAPIAFLPGRAELAGTGEEQLAQLASFLASRPGITVTLDGTPTASDVRWLREQALRAELAAGQGVIGTLRTLTQRGTRDTIRKALEARAAGQEGALSPDDAATLEQWLAERPPPTPEDLRRLAEERTARIASELHQRYGVEERRIVRAAPADPRPEGTPGVQVAIGVLDS